METIINFVGGILGWALAIAIYALAIFFIYIVVRQFWRDFKAKIIREAAAKQAAQPKQTYPDFGITEGSKP